MGNVRAIQHRTKGSNRLCTQWLMRGRPIGLLLVDLAGP